MARKSGKSKTTVPENETKSERFIRVITPRINKAVKAIKVVGYCAGTTYEYTPAQVKQILNALLTAVQGVEQNFESKTSVDEIFTFGD